MMRYEQAQAQIETSVAEGKIRRVASDEAGRPFASPACRQRRQVDVREDWRHAEPIRQATAGASYVQGPSSRQRRDRLPDAAGDLSLACQRLHSIVDRGNRDDGMSESAQHGSFRASVPSDPPPRGRPAAPPRGNGYSGESPGARTDPQAGPPEYEPMTQV